MPLEGDAHVSGQHQKTLDEAGDNHGENDNGNSTDNGPDSVRYQQQWQERRNRRDRSAQDRCRHATGGRFSCEPGVETSPVQCFRMFSYDNGVIDDDAQDHNDGKHTDHVYGLTGEPHDQHGGGECNRDAGGDPEGHPRVKEQEQDDQHDRQTHSAVLDQQVQATPDEFGLDVERCYTEIRRQGRSDLLQIVRDRIRDGQRIRVRCSHGLQHNGPVAVTPIIGAVVVETFPYIRDITEEQLFSARERL